MLRFLSPPNRVVHLATDTLPFRSRRCRRRGVAVVELAVVAPLFFLIVIAILEFGRMIMVQQVLTNASRSGARRAIVEGATQAEVETHVTNYLSNSAVRGATVTVDPSDLGAVGFGDPVNVTVAISFDTASWTPAPWFLGGVTLQARTMMQAERIQ